MYLTICKRRYVKTQVWRKFFWKNVCWQCYNLYICI